MIVTSSRKIAMTKIVAIHGQQKWEYCTETRYTEIPFLAALNERGQQGWEVINIVHYKEPKSGNMAWTAYLQPSQRGSCGHAPWRTRGHALANARRPSCPWRNIIRASSA